MTSGKPQYSRVEFTSDIGCGGKVVVFVEFNSQGISLDIPQHVTITEGAPAFHLLTWVNRLINKGSFLVY